MAKKNAKAKKAEVETDVVPKFCLTQSEYDSVMSVRSTAGRLACLMGILVGEGA